MTNGATVGRGQGESEFGCHFERKHRGLLIATETTGARNMREREPYDGSNGEDECF